MLLTMKNDMHLINKEYALSLIDTAKMAVINEVIIEDDEKIKFVLNHIANMYDVISNGIDNLPVEDAVKVVRCKDCKFARREDGMPKGYRKCVNIINEGNNQWRSTNDFCSYGWKKGEANWIKENE